MAKPKNLLGQVIGNMFFCPKDKNKNHPGKTLLAGEKVNQCHWCMYRETLKESDKWQDDNKV